MQFIFYIHHFFIVFACHIEWSFVSDDVHFWNFVFFFKYSNNQNGNAWASFDKGFQIDSIFLLLLLLLFIECNRIYPWCVSLKKCVNEMNILMRDSQERWEDFRSSVKVQHFNLILFSHLQFIFIIAFPKPKCEKNRRRRSDFIADIETHTSCNDFCFPKLIHLNRQLFNWSMSF